MPLFEVLPHLYLASYQSASDDSPQDAYIVNCTKDLPMVRRNGMRVAVDDDMSRDAMHGMFRALPDVVDKVHELICQNIDVVVHCMAGQQRSPTVIAAYLVRYQGYSLEEAIRHIRNTKKDAFFWNINFCESLEWYVKLIT